MTLFGSIYIFFPACATLIFQYNMCKQTLHWDDYGVIVDMSRYRLDVIAESNGIQPHYPHLLFYLFFSPSPPLFCFLFCFRESLILSQMPFYIKFDLFCMKLFKSNDYVQVTGPFTVVPSFFSTLFFQLTPLFVCLLVGGGG